MLSFTGVPWSGVNLSDLFDDFNTKEGNWAEFWLND